jgi:uncharacterized protein (DUF58 family)
MFTSGNANAFRLAFFTAVIYIAAITVGLRLLYYLAYVLAAVLVAAFIWSHLNKRGLLVKRQLQRTTAQVGQTVQETVEIQNRTLLPKLWLEVRDRSTLPGHHVGAVISLKGRGAKRWQVRTRCLRRGLYRLGPTVILTGDPFGLFQSSRLFDSGSELLVYPPTVPLSQFGLPATDLPGGSKTQRRAYQSTPNAAGIREYLPGDPVNRIHWAVSARVQKLMVKEFELDPTSDVWLVLDLHETVHVESPDAEAWPASSFATAPQPAQPRRPGETPARPTRPSGESGKLRLEPTTEEYSIAVAASLASHFIEQGRAVGLISWGQHKVTLPADRGGRQLVKILRALAVLRAEGTTPLAEILTAESRQFSRQDTLVVVTPSLESGWLEALQLQLYKGITAASVLVEPATFGGSGNSLMMVSALSAMEVPTYLIKRDDALDAALAREYGPGAMRNTR